MEAGRAGTAPLASAISGDEDSFMLVMVTAPNMMCGKQMSIDLVRDKLAACVNIVDSVHSVYRWKEEVQEDTECLMIIKTLRSQFENLKAAVLAKHPYDCPEVIMIPIVDGYSEYLKWIRECVL